MNFKSKLFWTMSGVMTVSILAMCIISAVLIVGAMEREIRTTRLSILRQTAENVVSNLKTLEQSTVIKSIDPVFSDTVRIVKSDDLNKIDQIVSQLREFKNESAAIHSVYLYLHNKGCIITSNDGYWEKERFYDNDALIEDFGSRNIVWRAVRDVDENTGLTKKVFSFALRFPDKSDNGSDYMIVNLSGGFLSTGFNSSSIEGESILLIAEDGTVLYDASGVMHGMRFDQDWFRDHLITEYRSQYNNWRFVNVVPKAYIMKPLNMYIAVFPIVAAVCIALVFFLVNRLSAGVYRPIANIIGELREYLDQSGILLQDSDSEYLRQSILAVLEQNRRLQKAFNDNTEDQRRTFLWNLLNGRFSSGFDYYKRMNQLQINFSSAEYYVILCSIDSASVTTSRFKPQDNYLMVYAFENIIGEIMEARFQFLTATMENDSVSILAVCQDSDLLNSVFEEIRSIVYNTLEITMTVAISERFTAIEDAQQAWDNCLELRSHRLELGSGIITEDKVLRGSDSHLPVISHQQRKQMLIHIQNGNTVQFAFEIDQLIDRIRSRPLPAPEIVFAAMLTILGDILSTVSQCGWKPSEVFGVSSKPFHDMINLNTLAEIGDYLKKMQKLSFEYITERKETKNKKLLDTIIDYIQTHYDEELHLNKVAAHVYLSPSYLSRLFKQEAGKNFHEYLTTVRLNKSKELLRDPELRIADIAKKTQFGTTNNFIKVFKRYEGVTPGVYRNTLAIDSLKDRVEEKEEKGKEDVKE
ncbi:MAG: AraC family transcriptional regulator [Oscillospiraceae bacterium]|nr:AraC family transcriptional regulator [Oscillospiraceae bacterium]